MVQPGQRRIADIHARPLAHSLESLEDLDLVGAVLLRSAVGWRVSVGRCVGLTALWANLKTLGGVGRDLMPTAATAKLQGHISRQLAKASNRCSRSAQIFGPSGA